MAIDYATAAHSRHWLRHPVLGDPSFDTFQRFSGNPVVQGSPPLEWVVNGSLFEDPQSGHWFLYAGRYTKGYVATHPCPPHEHMICTIHRSCDHGESWEELGPAFTDLEQFAFEGDSQPAGLIPDVTVTYADGLYHMAFDWVYSSLFARSLHEMKDRQEVDSGVGYAWSETPAGPFHRSPRPLLRNSAQPQLGVLGAKYQRYYASTLVRRENDWLLLTINDSNEYYAWSLVGMTAPSPEGPFENHRLLFHVDGDRYHAPLMEYFPAMVHDGWIYAPATAVALNRNFQTVHRVRVEEAMEPEAWELFQHGSVWHGEDHPSERWGIWGQTFSGFVDRAGYLNVMYPSKDGQDCGTIGLARRKWREPQRERGFFLSGHEGPSCTVLRRAYGAFRLEAEFDLRGETTLAWRYHSRLGPDEPKSNATLHPLTLTGYDGLKLSPAGWQVVSVDSRGNVSVIGLGSWSSRPTRRVTIERLADGAITIVSDAGELWRGILDSQSGPLVLHVARYSYLRVNRFTLDTAGEAATVSFVYTEALIGAGQRLADWLEERGGSYRFGCGAVHRGTGGRAKWNFEGTGIALWSPRGPELGCVEILLDGTMVAEVDLHADELRQSAVVWSQHGLKAGYHALVVRGRTGPVVIDSCDVYV